jgi:hypothetical protein
MPLRNESSRTPIRCDLAKPSHQSRTRTHACELQTILIDAFARYILIRVHLYVGFVKATLSHCSGIAAVWRDPAHLTPLIQVESARSVTSLV